MARKFLTPIDHSGLESLQRRLQNVGSLPAGLTTGDAGREAFINGRVWWWTGSGWDHQAASADLLNGASDGLGHAGAWYQARANQTGQQFASTISDLASAVQATRLDQFAAPTAAVSFNGQLITGVADPIAQQGAATKAYVDNVIAALTAGQILKGAVRVVATTNVSITTAPSTIDGITLAAGDYVLLTGQTVPAQNGPRVFTAAGAALNRAPNFDTSSEAQLGSYWIVREGSSADLFAMLTNDTAITLDTTALTFVVRGMPSNTYIAGNGLQLIGSTFSVVPASGGGLVVTGSGVAIDTSVVARVVKGIIPAASAGIVTVSGATVSIAHGLGNWAPRVTLRYYTSPGSGNTQGALIEVEEVATDGNNLVLTLAAAPASNQYYYSITG